MYNIKKVKTKSLLVNSLKNGFAGVDFLQNMAKKEYRQVGKFSWLLFFTGMVSLHDS